MDNTGITYQYLMISPISIIIDNSEMGKSQEQYGQTL